MTSPTSVVVHPDAHVLADAVAARLVTALVDAQSARGSADLVLTGGTVGIAVLAAVRETRARHAVDWGMVDVWWGDERFEPTGDPLRVDAQAREALLDHVRLDPARVHAMPPTDGPDGNDPDAAAARYADELARHAPAGERVPTFDVLLLGVGPDAHVASLFPGHPAVHETGRTVVAVRNSPKPPPTRLSLTLPAIGAASEVWFVVAGDDKADAVSRGLSGAAHVEVPCAGPSGRRATRWLIDRAAASRLPAGRGGAAGP